MYNVIVIELNEPKGAFFTFNKYNYLKEKYREYAMFIKKLTFMNKFLLIFLVLTIVGILLSGIISEKAYADKPLPAPMNMLKLLDVAIQSKQNFNIDNLTLFSPLNGNVIKILAESYNPSLLNVYVPICADYPENTTETITFVACNESDICFNNNQWIGTAFSDTVLIPGRSSINLHHYITGSISSQELSIYGMINARNIQTEPIIVFTYSDVSSQTIQIQIEEVSALVDMDNNGLPDNMETVVASGQLWIANQWINNALRNVYIQNLNVAGDTTKLIPLDSVEIETPTLGKLKREGLIPLQTNSAYLVAVVSNDISAQIDVITEKTGAKDLSSWIADATNKAPGNLNQEIGYLGIYLFYSNEQGQNQVLSLPEMTPIKVNIQGISTPDWVKIKAFSFPAMVLNTLLTNDLEREKKWTEIQSTTSQQRITLDIQECGITALYNLGLNITTVTPNQIPKGMETPLTLQGIIPVSTAKSIAEASALYQVRIGGKTASFRDGSTNNTDIAITPYHGTGENKMFVTAPVLDTPGPADLEIIDKTVDGLSFVFLDAVTVLDVFHITTEIDRGPNAQSQGAEITINPVKNSSLPEDGMFFEGDTVTLSIQNIDEEDQFDGWYSADGILFSRLPELIIRVKKDLHLKAKILRRQYALNITIYPPNTGIVVANPYGETFAPGTEVELTAEPVAGHQFKEWLLPNSNTSTDNPLKLKMDKEYSITAVFETGPPEFSGIARLAQGDFETDNNGKERLVVWAFGGIVWRVNGYNLEEDTPLQLIDTKTNKPIGSPFTGIKAAEDGTYLDFIIPPYPLYSDTMPAYVDVDIKTGGTTIPAFRYYHYSKDNFNIYTTAFITDLSKSEKISIFIDGSAQGTIQFPVVGESTGPTYGLIRTINILNNPIPSASASLIGNTLIHGGMYGSPILNTYEVAYYLYRADTISNTEPPEVGTAIYSSAKDAQDRPLFSQTIYPYKLDGTTQDVPTIKITLPTNGLDYNYFRGGISVFGQYSEYDYVNKQVFPKNRTAYQSQILATDIDPAMTEYSSGSTQKITLRAYSLNGFGIRMHSLLPFEVASLVRIAGDKGIMVVKTAGDEEVNIVAPRGGLGYVDRVELLNLDEGINEVVRPKSTAGQTEGLLTFKTPKVEKPGVVEVLIYLNSQPTVPAVVLNNVLMYSRNPVLLDSWILIPVGFILTTLGFVAGGSSGGGGPCFIATAAYGTPMAEEIDILRQFRDQYLLTNVIGTAFVDLYYNMSPPLADWIAHHPFFALLTRCLLTPIVWFSKLAIFYPLLFHIFIISTGICIIFYYQKKKQRI